MKTLITGGAGFIGSHLADELLFRNHEVSAIDNLSTGRLENTKHLRENKQFHLTIDTILNEAVMEELIQECDEIYHLAAAVGVKLIMNNPVESIETNVKGTEIVLRLANKYRKKVLIVSTSEVYGKHVEHTLQEDDNRVMGSVKKRRWAYACSKTIDEFLALAYYEEKKLPTIIVRLFNTVGPRQTGQYGMVIPNFVQKALLNKPIAIHGDGKQSRSFIHVKDAVRGLIDIMAHPDAIGDIFNIGNGKEITIEDLALMVKKMTKSNSEIIYIPYEEVYGPGFEDMQRRCPNTSKIKNLISFEPTVDIDGIIESVIEYYKE